MSRNNFWRAVLVALVLVWSLFELYPPTGRDLTLVFREQAANRDATFSTIVSNVMVLQKAMPERAYDNLVEAIGTNDITRYFPAFEAKNELHPTTHILNRLQRKAAGRIRLGLDLQGGTSFLVEMQTNRLAEADTTNQVNRASDSGAALSQAVEVLRKRVDNLGVAEPIIQPEGNYRIRVQLPGLSAADQESAKVRIQKAAFLEFRMVHPQSDELLKQGIIEPGYEVLAHKTN